MFTIIFKDVLRFCQMFLSVNVVELGSEDDVDISHQKCYKELRLLQWCMYDT